MGLVISQEQYISDLQCKQKELRDIPHDKRTEQVCLAAIKYNCTLRTVFAIPKDKLTDEVCLELLKKDYNAIKTLKDCGKKITLDMYIAAVDRNFRALYDVPYKKRTKKCV